MKHRCTNKMTKIFKIYSVLLFISLFSVFVYGCDVLTGSGSDAGSPITVEVTGTGDGTVIADIQGLRNIENGLFAVSSDGGGKWNVIEGPKIPKRFRDVGVDIVDLYAKGGENIFAMFGGGFKDSILVRRKRADGILSSNTQWENYTPFDFYSDAPIIPLIGSQDYMSVIGKGEIGSELVVTYRSKGVYITRTRVNDWKQVNRKRYYGIEKGSENSLYALSIDSLVKSTDRGRTWDEISKLEYNDSTDAKSLYSRMSVDTTNKRIYLSRSDKILSVPVDGGDLSMPVEVSPTAPDSLDTINNIEVGKNGKVYVSDDTGVYFSEDGISSWEPCNNSKFNIDSSLGIDYPDIRDIYISGRGIIYVSARDGLFSSSNECQSWFLEIGPGGIK